MVFLNRLLQNFSAVLRHVAGGRRMMRDEDADVDTATGPAAGSASGVCNVDDELLMKAARSRRVAHPSPMTFHTADTGCFGFSLAGLPYHFENLEKSGN